MKLLELEMLLKKSRESGATDESKVYLGINNGCWDGVARYVGVCDDGDISIFKYRHDAAVQGVDIVEVG